MKNSIPLPRTKTVMSLFFFLFISATSSFAQSTSDRTAIKEWIIANKDKMTLVTMKEYQTMSPAVKSVLDADPKTLVYNTEVTLDNIYAFENKNVSKNLTPFRTEREKANEAEAVARTAKERQNADLQAIKDQKEAEAILQERQNAELLIAKAEQERIGIWRSDNPDLKIISYQDYMSRPEADQKEMEANGLLVCDGDKLTLKDIERFQKGQILPYKY